MLSCLGSQLGVIVIQPGRLMHCSHVLRSAQAMIAQFLRKQVHEALNLRNTD
jgi:hypothetical protein